MQIVARIALKCLDLSRFVIFLWLFFLTPFLFGGAGKTPVFFIQSLTFSFFFLYLTKICFFDFTPSFANYRGVRFPFAVFCIFIVYVFVQWLGGQLVFLKIIPGTITSYRTMDYLVQLICYFLFS